MTLQTITVNLPQKLYKKIRQQAEDKNRSVEDELAAVVESALSADNAWAGIPSDIAEEAKQLHFLDDEHLWRAAKSTVPAAKSERMQLLSEKQELEGLNRTEQEEIEQLQHLAQRIMLIRAEAAVLLQERGHDISTLRQTTSPS